MTFEQQERRKPIHERRRVSVYAMPALAARLPARAAPGRPSAETMDAAVAMVVNQAGDAGLGMLEQAIARWRRRQGSVAQRAADLMAGRGRAVQEAEERAREIREAPAVADIEEASDA